jgi:hypothetical protein
MIFGYSEIFHTEHDRSPPFITAGMLGDAEAYSGSVQT